MVRDVEQKTIAEMSEMMMKAIHENGINPMQAMSLVGYAARQVVTDISRSIEIGQDQAVIMSLGAMLPEGYLRELRNGGQKPSCGCAK